MTKQQRETGADHPEDEPQVVKTDPQRETVEENSEAQGLEHDCAYLEEVTCLR